ncbi:MAG: hypothetical protein R3286_05265 [Gammaproteobacteria bacterium]|nr:hypothetical protein [Gammaproteobacteria bacterium]
MNIKPLRVVFLATAVAVLAACAQPVYNVKDAPVSTNLQSPSLDDVTMAIRRAGASLGWQMKEQTPGHMVGTLNIRRHMAMVDITYNLREFSIQYRDSTNLDYDGTSIHRNYNGWIQNLENAIKVQLTTL